MPNEHESSLVINHFSKVLISSMALPVISLEFKPSLKKKKKKTTQVILLNTKFLIFLEVYFFKRDWLKYLKSEGKIFIYLQTK